MSHLCNVGIDSSIVGHIQYLIIYRVFMIRGTVGLQMPAKVHISVAIFEMQWNLCDELKHHIITCHFNQDGMHFSLISL